MPLVANKGQTQFTVLLRNNPPLRPRIVSNIVGSKLSKWDNDFVGADAQGLAML